LSRETTIYALALRKDVKNPFPPESDEVSVAKEGADAQKADPAKPKDDGVPTEPKEPVKDINRELKKEPADTSKQQDAARPGGGRTASSAKPAAGITIDFDGLEQRVTRVPVQADNYGGAFAKNDHLFHAVGAAFYYGRQGDRPTALKMFSMKDRKEASLAEEIRGYVLSDDG